jgi:hypothetical protein
MARFGSGLFLIIQMIILLDFCQTWNDAWAEYGEEDPRWLYLLLGITVTGFLATLGVAGRGQERETGAQPVGMHACICGRLACCVPRGGWEHA